MPLGMTRRDLPLAIGAFLVGLLVSGAAAAAWLMTLTGRGSDAVVIEETTDPRETGSANGEIALANRAITDRLTAARAPTAPIRGGISVRAGDIRWTDGPRRPFVRANSVSGVLNAAAAERGDIIIDRVVVSDANVLLDQPSAAGQWNYERVMAELLADDGAAGPRRTFVLTNVTVRDTRVEVHQPTRDLALDDIVANIARVQLSTPASEVPAIDVRSVVTTFTDLRKDKSIAVRAEDAHITLPEGQTDFKVARATVGTTRLADLEGRWRPADGGIGLTMSGRAIDVQLAELAPFNERIPTEGRGSFRFAVKPLGGERMEVRLTEADVTAEGSRVRGAVAVRIGGKQIDIISVDARLDPLALALVERMSGRDLPYGGTLRGTVRGTGENLGFNLNASITSATSTQPFVSNLEGRVRFVGGTFSLQHVTANLDKVPAEALRTFVPNLPFKGAITGTVTLNGPPERAPLNLAVRLDLASGVAMVNGRLDLTGAEPVYDLNGRLIGVNLDQILEPKAPPAALTARFEVRGRGFKPETADAQVNVTGRFTGWRTEPHDTLVIDARVRNGAIAVDHGALALGPVHLEARGDWRFVSPETGSITYKFNVENLAPIAQYIPILPDTAGGAIQGSGSFAGSLKNMRIEGELSGTNVKIARWQSTSLQAKHRLVIGGTVPEIFLDAKVDNISTPSTGAYKTLTAKVELMPPGFSMDIKAERISGGLIEIAADGRVPYEGARRVVLQRARLDLGQGTWALQSPAAIDWAGGDGVKVSNLSLRANEGEGHLALNGRIYPFENIDARFETAALPLDEVQSLLGRDTIFSGLLWANATVRGPGQSPTFDITFRVDSGGYQAVRFNRFEGKLGYSGRTLTATALATVDSAGRLDAKASLPMEVTFTPEFKFDLLDSGPASGSIVADSVALGAFAGLLRDVRDVEGFVRANATLSGTAGNPDLEGNITVTGGAATFIALNRRYTDLNGEIVFNRREAEVRSLKLRSGGEANVTGKIEFPDLANPVANFTVALERFRPAGVEDHPDAAATGELTVRGPLFGPTISGAIRLDDGDVPIPTVGSTPLDAQLTELVGPIEIEPSQEDEHRGHGSLVDNTVVENLRVTAGEGLWFSMQNARAQLSGELTVNKRGHDISVVGTMEGNRGTYTLEAGPILRRFEVTHAEIRFLGGNEINPAIDITARRVVLDQTGREMDVEIRVGGTMKSPTLALGSQDASLIPQSELLSYLLFGQGTLGLNTGGFGIPGEQLVTETLLGGLTELASLELENALGRGIDIFQIRLGGGGLGGVLSPTLVVGHEITSDIFLTVETGIGTLFGASTGTSGTSTPMGVALRLEWRIDPRTSLRVGYETVNRNRFWRGLAATLPNTLQQQQQLSVELRKRWRW